MARNTHCDPETKIELKNLLEKNIDIFANPKIPLTTNNFYKQKINLHDTAPVFSKPYRIPQSQKQEIDSQISKIIKDGIIEPSISSYNSPILLLPKKSTDDKKKFRCPE
jgi:hypothetical protein